MNLVELDQLFEDPENRRWGIFYHCPSDPRVIAPSRPDWRGYQINFAHPRAFPTLILYVTLLLGPAGLVFACGPQTPWSLTIVVGLALSVSVVFLIAVSARLSKSFPSG